MDMTVNIAGQVAQIKLPPAKALWPLFETVVNSLQSLEDSDVSEKKIIVNAMRPEYVQLQDDGQGNTIEEQAHFDSFVVSDNGNGFNEENYRSFLVSYSRLKAKKGCKGIGRFLWLKAFDEVSVKSIYFENGNLHCRAFNFSLKGIDPEQNDKIVDNSKGPQLTTVSLAGFKNPYHDAVAYSLESLAKKLIEHCLLYFITEGCPSIILQDNRGEVIDLNSYYENTYQDSLHRDEIVINGNHFTLYHMLLAEGADKHELHLCANKREVKSYALSALIPDMKKKFVSDEGSFYYVGYLTGDCLDEAVNSDRSDFVFLEGSLFDNINESEIVGASVNYIRNYLHADLDKVAGEKKTQIDRLVMAWHPQYRLLLDRHPEVYDKIPAGLSDEKLDIELYKQQQQWELEIVEKKHAIEEKVKYDATSDPDFQKLFDEYCENITELSRASLAEYVARRKAVIDLLGRALETDKDGNYSKEDRIHRIICPMQATSDEIEFDHMNLWLIDDRLAYHRFLASDKKMNSIPFLESAKDKRMDLAIFDAALSYAADPENINSITIVELKRPQRDDLSSEDKDPIIQVYDYVSDIKEGKVKKANGRGFGNIQNVSFYCYVIADLTPSLRKSAARAGLVPTQDGEGYFGYNQNVGTYIEVISYDKLLKDAKQRNQALFDSLFEPKAKKLAHPEWLREQSQQS